MSTHNYLTVIGGGLAGCEAAWQAARQGIQVLLFEMRPKVRTGAHQGGMLAELVCSNSLGSNLPDRASGLLKQELRLLDSMLLACAEAAALPAGSALAVDRDRFASLVTEQILAHPLIKVIREEATDIPEGSAIIASGPLTSAQLSRAISKLTGEEHLFFYDAVAPIVSKDSIDFTIAFHASRYGKGENQQGDYINCPFTKDEYEQFVKALGSAKRAVLRTFEKEIEQGVRAGIDKFFEGCLPVEIMAHRGTQALAFGPMRPVGLTDPHTGKRPYAAVQLRQDNLAGDLYNLVGFQTNLTVSEQERIFRMIPGLKNARFVRFGQMHRNTFIASPKVLMPSLQFRNREDLFFAGQITGVEGYVGNIASGWLAGWNAARVYKGQAALSLPQTTMLGALCHYITHADLRDFQPMKANFGILPAIQTGRKMGKRERAGIYAQRAMLDLKEFMKHQVER